MRTFKKFTKILAVVAAVGLWAGGALAQPFNFSNPTPRQMLVDSEGLQDQGCVNKYDNTTGYPPTSSAGCNDVTGVGCPNHPNLRGPLTSCTVYASTTPQTVDGPFFYADEILVPGTPNNDYWANAAPVAGSVWNVSVPPEVWGSVTQRTLGQSNAQVLTASNMSMNIDTALTGAGSVTPTTVNASGTPVFYQGSALFNGTTTLGLFGVPSQYDAPYMGQSQDPLVFAVADAGIPLVYSCNHAANVVPPTPIAFPFNETTGGAGTLLTTAPSDPSYPAGGFATYCAAVGLPGCFFGTNARILSGASAGAIVDIIGQTSSTLTLADPVTVAVNDQFLIEAYSSIGGAPFPQGPVYGSICPNAVGTTANLPQEPGYDTAASPTVEQATVFISAFTTAGTNPLTNPVWSNFDLRFEEAPDADADGIPDRFDNCDAVSNGPLTGGSPAAGGCYCMMDNTGACTAIPAAAVGFLQADQDGDGYGDSCDGDFLVDGAVDGFDVPAFAVDLGAGTDSGIGSDMNCDGAVDGFDVPFFSNLLGGGLSGPSGLWCAGSGTPNAPCIF